MVVNLAIGDGTIVATADVFATVDYVMIPRPRNDGSARLFVRQQSDSTLFIEADHGQIVQPAAVTWLDDD